MSKRLLTGEEQDSLDANVMAMLRGIYRGI